MNHFPKMSSDHHHTSSNNEKSLSIKQDDKFFSRLMSKETSMANSSCRVYYGGASGAVPFMWESQPGTPKHPSSESTLPPLTPPPSYHSSHNSKSIKKKSLKPTFLASIFFPWRHQASPSSSRSSTSSSSSLSSYSYSPSLGRKMCRRSLFSCSRSPVHSCLDDEDDESLRSPTSTLCFGVKRRNLFEFRGYCHTSMVNMKKKALKVLLPRDY